MRNLTLIGFLFLVLGLIGCSRNPLAPAGVISIGGENKTSGGGAPFFAIADPEPGSYNDEVTVSIDKLEITTDGSSWTKVYEGGNTLHITSSGIGSVGYPVAVDRDEYHGVRVWFGPDIKVKRKFDDGSVNESNRSDLNKANPFVFTTGLEGGLSYPFTVERGKEVFIIFQFELGSIYRGVRSSDSDWVNYRDNQMKDDISVRTTRIGG